MLQYLAYFALLLSNFTVDSLNKLWKWCSFLFILLILLSFLVGLIWPFTIVGIQFEFQSLIDWHCTSWWLGWWKLLNGIPLVMSNWWILHSSIVLLHVVVCGSLSYFRHFRSPISIIVNSCFWKVSQHSISVHIYCGLSFLVGVRITCLVFIIRSFRRYVRPLIRRSNINTRFTFRGALGDLVVFSVVISFISLYKSLIINWDELNSLCVFSNWLSNSAHFRQL
jgi:hypothetical protein